MALLKVMVLIVITATAINGNLREDFTKWTEKLRLHAGDKMDVQKELDKARKKSASLTDYDAVSVQIVYLYTQQTNRIYRFTNDYLRKLSPDYKGLWKKYAGLLSRGIDKLSSEENCNLTVYRGMVRLPEWENITDENTNRKLKRFPEFLSTSTNVSVALGFMERVPGKKAFLKLFGVCGLPVKTFSPFEEEEVLLDKGSLFEVITATGDKSKIMAEMKKENASRMDRVAKADLYLVLKYVGSGGGNLNASIAIVIFAIIMAFLG